MDLRSYYEAIRKIEAEITQADVVVVSLETADGGRGGLKSTVPRNLAARLIAEGRAVLESGVAAADNSPGRKVDRAQRGLTGRCAIEGES